MPVFKYYHLFNSFKNYKAAGRVQIIFQSTRSVWSSNTFSFHCHCRYNSKMAFPKWGKFAAPVSVSTTLDTADYDSLVLVSTSIESVKRTSDGLVQILSRQSELDLSVEKEGCVLPIQLASQRLVYTPVGPVDRDYDDVRRYAEAAGKGVKRAISAGSKKPMLVVPPNDRFPNANLVAILGALEALYVPIQYREDVPEKAAKITELGIYGQNADETNRLIELATGIESGRFVARDIGGGDPERMAPPRVAEYVQKLFANSPISLEIISDEKVFEKEYPLFAAVNRAASLITRHQGRIIYLTYTGEGPITKTIMPCGKGITYDTGGADIKAGGIMAGMSRDKCGAAAVAGFFQVLSVLRPKGIKAIGVMAVARNSVGENCYVADELIVSRAGLRCRIGNTDAEGRMVMTDPLCKLKEIALNEVNPHLMTIATLTGHACLAVGEYTALMDNGPASKEQFAQKIQAAGETLGDMIEISTLRREDYNFVKSNIDGEDLIQCNNLASSRTPRGHQFPAAFMILGSGLDKHGSDSKHPLKYTHIDIAGSSGHFPVTPTAVPVLALTKLFFGDQLKI